MGSKRSIRWWWAEAPGEALTRLANSLESDLPIDGLETIKASERRRVAAVPDVDGGVLLKVFHVRDFEAVKYRLVSSRARAEFRAAVALRRRGVPVAEGLGYGEERVGRRLIRAWFLGRFVPGASSIGAALREARERGSVDRVQAILRKSLEVVAKLHRHPFLHRDLHANNLLLDANDRALLIDLHSVWRVPRVTRSMRVGNLARLFFSMRRSIDLDQIAVEVRDHARRMNDRPEPFVLDVLAAIEAFDREYVRGRTARCLKRSTLFGRERVGSGRCFRRLDYAVAQLARDSELHVEALQVDGVSVLGRAPKSLVTRVGEGPRQRVIKEYTARGPFASIRQLAGRGRARSAWIGARRLDVLGLPTPRALALHERLDGSSVLVTESIGDPPSLRSLTDAPSTDLKASDRFAIARALGNIVGRLARAGVRHDDLSSKNVLVGRPPTPPSPDIRTQPSPEWPCVQLIDLDNMSCMPPFDPAGIQRMLSQLCDLRIPISRADRQRFLRAYASAAGRPLSREVGDAALAGSRARSARRDAARPAPA
jgi:tRNA A-37 threonylcarbamoyl transferase component Bud32